MRATLRACVQPVDSHGTFGAILDVAGAQRPVVGEPLEDVRAELVLGLPPGGHPRAPAARRPHQVAVDRQVLAEHVGRLVRPVLEQRALLVGELLELALVERAVAREQHEQVVARDDRRRVELQAAQRADGVEQGLGRAGPRAAGCGSRGGGRRRAWR